MPKVRSDAFALRAFQIIDGENTPPIEEPVSAREPADRVAHVDAWHVFPDSRPPIDLMDITPASPSAAAQSTRTNTPAGHVRNSVGRLMSSAVIVSAVSFTSTLGRHDEVSASYRA